MKLSVVVGTYNRADQIKRCIDSIERETDSPHVVYVTDGGSSDGTVEYLEAVASERIRPIFVGRLLGQAKAYNEVFARVETPYVCWLSDDNEVVNGGLDKALNILEEDARIGMVGLKTRDVEGPFVAAPYIGGISQIGILNVNQGMLPSALLRRLGGFSEVFRDYGIDPDLTAKVLFSGNKVVYTRMIALHHHRNWEMDQTSPEYQALMKKHERSRRLYNAKYVNLIGNSVELRLKQKLFSLVQKHLAGNNFMNSTRTWLGGIPRDWYNAMNGRFIRALDPLVFRGRAYHLVQSCPKKLVPEALPAEPDERCVLGHG